LHKLISAAAATNTTTTTTTFIFLPFNPAYFSAYHSMLGQVPKGFQEQLLGISGAKFLQAICPSCHPTNSVKALKNKDNTRSVSLSLF